MERVPGVPSPPAETVSQWLGSSLGNAPEALVLRILDAVAPHGSEPVENVPDVCLTAADRIVSQLLESGATSRDTAIDLLAADALVTVAFQAVAERGGAVSDLARYSMQGIAKLSAS